MKLEFNALKNEILAAENLIWARLIRGRKPLNLGTDIAEELSALCMSRLEGVAWLVDGKSVKGYDLYSELGKIEVKSVASLHRNIGGLQDKRVADRIIVVWFSENRLSSVERVMLYDTEFILNRVAGSGNKKGLLTYKLQKELYHAGIGHEITEPFQLVLDEVMNS